MKTEDYTEIVFIENVAQGDETYTITFGDRAENSVGMQKIGAMAEEGQGFDREDIKSAQEWFQERGVECKVVFLHESLEDEEDAVQNIGWAKWTKGELDAYVLIARNGLETLLAGMASADEFYLEQANLEKDSKCVMYGQLRNKHARHNLCFGEEDQEPDYENKKGRIVSFSKLPLLSLARETLKEVLGEKAKGLYAEGNYYYDLAKCGIGFHGDGERRKVAAVRVGASMPLHYQWFYKGKPVGKRIKLTLNHGDVYIMSEKAVGSDWKKKNIYTLRHAAGANKFLQIKEK